MDKRILVVDDDVAVRDLIYEALTRQGYKVITATGGKAALEAFVGHNPDLVLLDFKMPRREGRRGTLISLVTVITAGSGDCTTS